MCVFCVFVHHVLIFFSFCFAFAPCHRCCCYLLCYVIPHLALMLFGVVCHSLPCVVITYYDVWPSPCNVTIVSCGPSSFTLCCCCLPWCIILRPALLLLAMVDCLHLCTLIVVYYGFLLFLVWFITLCFALLLLIVVHCFHHALLLFGVVHCP